MKITRRNPLRAGYLFILLLAIQCSDQAPKNEIVIHRFPDGSPKEVWIYPEAKNSNLRTEILYFENGRKQRQRQMNNDLPDGPWIEWHRNGQKKYEKNYHAGNLDGEQLGWFMSGEPLYKSTFEDGQQISRITWDIHGNIVSRN